MDSGCSTAVEHTPHDREVVGLKPNECWTYSALYLIIQNWVPHRGATQLIFLETYECLAVQLEAKQA